MSERNERPPVVFRDVSRFYGEVLGVNRVSFELQPGITSLVGPNGSGKSTLMNLMFGLLRPSRGEISVFGHSPYEPEKISTGSDTAPSMTPSPGALRETIFLVLFCGSGVSPGTRPGS